MVLLISHARQFWTSFFQLLGCIKHSISLLMRFAFINVPEVLNSVTFYGKKGEQFKLTPSYKKIKLTI